MQVQFRSSKVSKTTTETDPMLKVFCLATSRIYKLVQSIARTCPSAVFAAESLLIRRVARNNEGDDVVIV